MKKNFVLSFGLVLLLVSSVSFSLQKDDRVEIYDLRYFTHPTFTRIVVDIGTLREYSPHELPSPDRIFVDIYQAKLNPILHNKTYLVKNDYINQIRIAQKSPNTVRVVVDIDFNRVKRFQVWPAFDPFRIVIDIYPSETGFDVSTEKPPQPAQPTKEGYSMARQLGLGIQKIVIDPGHGGKDPGAIGKSGTMEKIIVLDICQRLKKLLGANNGLEVIMTRESDIYVPVENRTVIANQKRADLFVSVHANANPSKKRSGVETFYLNFSQDPSVIETAALENATSTKNLSEMRSILEKIVKNSKVMESKELANDIQKNLVLTLQKKYKDVKDLGYKGGPFWVLIGVETPSILVEVSYLSNPREETRLKNTQYRQYIAQGIYNGIKEYMNSLGKGI
ncbi:MAG: N-acetylmuramoyl-L-alanine amidase [Candidatus Aminicenantaceae bacterium]